MKIQVYRIIEKTLMAGPGYRFCLWVQGCNHQCKGCMASDTWSFDGGTSMDTDDIFEKIQSVKGIEGITFLGGEPLEQPESVLEIARMAKAINLSVTVFTGFTYEQLQNSKNDTINQLLGVIDLLIDGPFIQEEYDLSRPWVGSSNQQYRFLTNRYSEKDLENIKNKIEIRISPDGQALINGMGDFEKIKKLL